MKSILVKLIDIWIKFWRNTVKNFYLIYDFFYKLFTSSPQVASREETVRYLIENECSLSRFGDGEIKLVAGRDISFQKNNPFITNKLREVLSSDENSLMVGIVDIFDDCSSFEKVHKDYWREHISRFRKVWYTYLRKNKQYYDASITRPYMGHNDRSKSEAFFNSLKMIWDDKDIVFIEGEGSRMGVGNDLFSNARSVRRIIGPSYQAFDKYDEILTQAKNLDKSTLILLAIGPAATGLSYDLHRAGYRAVDIGHIDIEYEWYLAGATTKSSVKNKVVHEARSDIGEFYDEKYESEILTKIL